MGPKIANVVDDYFGVGYEVNEQIIRSDSTSQFTKREFSLRPTFQVRVLPNTFFGVGYRYNSLNVTKTNAMMASDPNYQRFGPKIIESGIYFDVAYDSRDMVINAYSGEFFSSLETHKCRCKKVKQRLATLLSAYV